MSNQAGSSPRSPTKYRGPNVYLAVEVSRNRRPTSTDFKQPETGKLYPLGTFWIVEKDPTTGVQGEIWYLSKVVSNIAFWVQLGASSSSSFQPNSNVNLFDEFLPDATSNIGQLSWANLGAVAIDTPSTSSHPGLITLSNDSLNGIVLTNSNLSLEFVLGGGVINNNFVLDLVGLSTVTNRYVFDIGMTDFENGDPSITNGIYFSYSDNVNSGNWVLNCTTSTVTTSVNTSIPASTGFHNYGIVVNAAGTSVSFTIDGISAGAAITTNIPTSEINPFVSQKRSAGALPGSIIDLWYFNQILTTPR